jgi:hypothetical protein
MQNASLAGWLAGLPVLLLCSFTWHDRQACWVIGGVGISG